MIEFGGHRYGISGSTRLDWLADQSLVSSVVGFFDGQSPTLQPEGIRLGRLFTARNISVIGGIRVRWTTNLVDHLLLADDDRNVFVFHSLGFLRFHEGFANVVLPTELIAETIRTLELLFPENDRKSRNWVESEIKSHNLDPNLSKCGSLKACERRFENFVYWHDRLVILKQAYDESSPRTISQWWNDRRNSVQWYTFWVDIMVFVFTLLFGVVQSIEGGLQVWLSWEARGSG
ncbi:hypothetical protein K456DRAFT_1755148 [Colletotrichum gloeosporioides 23]|nr:hypothetical protein K456DRAFT_1755148 [Colletotrichum gloeosporioides 23]